MLTHQQSDEAGDSISEGQWEFSAKRGAEMCIISAREGVQSEAAGHETGN